MSANARTTRDILAENKSISAVIDRQPIIDDPAKELLPHPRYSDGDSYYIVSYVNGGGHKFTVLFHLMLIVKAFGTPVAQLVISVLDETTGAYFRKEVNKFWLIDTSVAPDKLNIAMPEGGLSGTIDQLIAKGHLLVDSNVDSTQLDMQLTMKPRGPVLPNLVTGVIPFSEGIDYEYAFPRMETSGVLTIGGKSYDVVGSSWFDREWGRFGPAKWTWMNIQLDNGVQISLWDEQDNAINPNSYVDGEHRFASILNPDGSLVVTSVDIKELGTWTSLKTQRTYANKWRVTIPGRGVLMVNVLQDGQEIVSELPAHRVEAKSSVEGTYADKRVKGFTMVEMFNLFPLFGALGG